MKKLLGLLFASTLILGACGGHKDSSESDQAINLPIVFPLIK